MMSNENVQMAANKTLMTVAIVIGMDHGHGQVENYRSRMLKCPY